MHHSRRPTYLCSDTMLCAGCLAEVTPAFGATGSSSAAVGTDRSKTTSACHCNSTHHLVQALRQLDRPEAGVELKRQVDQ